jgi:hypothetical protein
VLADPACAVAETGVTSDFRVTGDQQEVFWLVAGNSAEATGDRCR